MGKFFNIEYFKTGSIKEHVFGTLGIGNCILCGKFIVLDSHHTVTQSRGGEEKDKVDVCRECHEWIGLHPLEASKLGLYKKGYKI
jgi:hypothetical protein